MTEYDVILHKKHFPFPHASEMTLVLWEGESILPAKDFPIYLDVFNRATNTWERLDCDDSSPAGARICLLGVRFGKALEYYDKKDYICSRVYQEKIV